MQRIARSHEGHQHFEIKYSFRHPERSEKPLFVSSSDASCASHSPRSSVIVFALLFLSLAIAASAKTKSQSVDSLDAYLATARKSTSGDDFRTTGSLWDPNGRMSDLTTDTKARFVGDLVTINIIESTSSAQQESAQTSRAFSASSSLAALLGTTNARAQNLFSPNSTQSLNGKGQPAIATP